jgi:chemotaxis protein MotB
MTLMFAFFVVMFASSNADKQKAQQFSEAVSRAFSEGQISSRIAQMLGGAPAASKGTHFKPNTTPPAPMKLVELAPSLKALTAELKKEIDAGKIQVNLEARGLIISLKEAAFFPSGDATVAREGYQVIEKVASTMRKLPNPVRLEGHTDSLPIRGGRYKDNWELSAARSIAMLQLFNMEFGIPVERMAAVAYAETLPISANDTDEGRARNRRVDIAILNAHAAAKEAQPAAAKTP